MVKEINVLLFEIINYPFKYNGKFSLTLNL